MNTAITRTKVAFRLLRGNVTAMVSKNICVRLLSVHFCLTIGYGAEVLDNNWRLLRTPYFYPESRLLSEIERLESIIAVKVCKRKSYVAGKKSAILRCIIYCVLTEQIFSRFPLHFVRYCPDFNFVPEDNLTQYSSRFMLRARELQELFF